MREDIAAVLKKSESLLNQKVCLKGWVRTRRDSKAGVSFIALNDGSCLAGIQVIAPNTLANYDSEILRLTKDCAIEVQGVLVASLGEGQAVEVQADAIRVLGFVEDPETYPMSAKRHSLEHLRDHAHLRVRTNLMSAVARLRHTVSHAIHQFFHEEKFFWVNTPIITASDCEGAGELFRISTLDALNPPKTPEGQVDFKQDFFGKEAYLTVSGQLNGECYACGLGKVYTFGPTFRAENSNTTRHLAEFWMVEPEVAFNTLSDNASLAEALLKYVLKAVFEEREEDLAFFNQWVDNTCLTRLRQVLEQPFVRMDYTEGVQLLLDSKRKFEYPVSWGLDLQSEHERYLCEQVVKGPLILMNYPKEIKAFYMRLNDDQKTVAAMDVLVPGVGEIIGGSQREERLEVFDRRLQELGLPISNYAWYRDLRRYGTVPHAGFGLGFERLVSYISGVSNIRDIHPFPRAPGVLSF